MVTVVFSNARPWLAVFAVLCSAALLVSTAPADEAVELRVRIAWGGGDPAPWRGRIWVDEGTIESAEPIGLGLESLRSFRKHPTAVDIFAARPRTYEAVDLQIRTSLSASLNISLAHADTVEARTIAIPFSTLVAGRHAQKLDDQGNQLTVERTHGDRLRVDIQREHVVFSPGEKWEVRVRPHRLGTSFSTSATLRARLLVARSDEERWSQEQRLMIDESGAIDQAVDVSVSLPEEEGVYDLELSVVRPRSRALIPANEVVVRRNIQVVVVADAEADSDEDSWNPSPVLEFDPAHPNLFQRLTNVSPWSGLAPGQPRSFGSRDTTTTQRTDSRSWTQLEGDGWQAYALPISRTGEAHMLEIEYPSDVAQTMGVSLLEPNAAGKVVPVGVDGAIHVESVLHESPRTQRYRMIFWPRTRLPYLILKNRSSTQPALFGAVRVFHREGSLPRVPIDRPAAGNRFAVARFSRPLFPEVFGATDMVDDQTGQALDDWVTFYDGAIRLIEFARYLGYDAISLTALCEGSAIFPTTDVQVTPKYDTGIYFSNGQDPVRKDVLELIFRLCDRNGIQLIPSLELSSPLASLESPTSSESTDVRLSNGRGDRQAAYNPLDARVQASLVGFIERTTQRYAHHQSFAGIGLTLTRGTSTHLPGPNWGSDPVTLADFAKSAPLSADQRNRITSDHEQMLLDPSYREMWLRWRAERLHAMYLAMAQTVRVAKPDALVYLTLDNLISEPTFSDAMLPRLPATHLKSQAFLEMGIQLDRYSEDQGLFVLQPHQYDPLKTLVARRSQLQMNRAVDFDPREGDIRSRGSSFFHVPQTLRLPEVDRQSPYGEQATFALAAPQILPSGPSSRRHLVQSLALHDVRTWFDGGWTIIRDQHDWFAPLIDVFRRLPEDHFTTADAQTSLGDRFVVRTLSKNGITYAYLVNNSPWAVRARLQLELSTGTELKALTPYKQPGTLETDTEDVWWKCSLQPYDVMAAVFTSHDVRVVKTMLELPDNVLPAIRNEIADLSGRVSSLAKPQERPFPGNAGFEATEPLEGWVSTQDTDVQVGVDATVARGGTKSLRIGNEAPVAWLRSAPFSVTDSGRLLVRVWAKHDGHSTPPRLRLMAESELSSQSYSRQSELAMPSDGSDVWQPYDLWIDDLPASLRELRFGVDVLGPGTVWLDDVQLFELAFSRGERNELSKIIALADLQLREGRVGDCRTTLDDYWMQFLRTYVPLSESHVARVAKGKRRTPAAAPPSDPQSIPKTSNALDRLKQFVPIFQR